MRIRLRDSPDECRALAELYLHSNGENWTTNYESWAGRDIWFETGAPCSWGGVVCNEGHVTELNLGWVNISNVAGKIPPEISLLTRLTRLELYQNNLISVPPEIGQLTQLTELNLGFNRLSSLPAEIGNLTWLTKLYLAGN